MLKRRYILLGLLLMGCLSSLIVLRWLEQSYDSPYAYVEENLYVGASVEVPPPGTQAVVNLCGRKDGYKADAEFWEPILEGGDDPDVKWLKKVVEFIDKHRRSGRQTYVHCLAGMNRSGMVVTAYLMYEHNWPREKALEFVRSKRSQIQPNPQLMRLLAEWEQYLKE